MSRRKKFWRKLIHRYRLVIRDEDAYQEKFTLKLNRINVFLVLGFGGLLLVGLTGLLIAFTPLREYLPGYRVNALAQRAQIEALAYHVDSIEKVMKTQRFYLQNLRRILNDEVSYTPVDSLQHADSIVRLPDSAFLPSKKDSAFRSQVAQEMQYNLTRFPKQIKSILLFAPVKGIVTDSFDLEKKHFAVDIACERNEAIKAAGDGTVLFAGWTADTGNTLVLQHAQNVITVYKHNATLYKREGQRVKGGTVIAAAGSSGELSTGPHLHFEVWIDGQPVDPLPYIRF